MSEDAIGQMFEKSQGRIVTVNLKFNDGSNFAGMRLSRGVMLIAHETEAVFGTRQRQTKRIKHTLFCYSS